MSSRKAQREAARQEREAREQAAERARRRRQLLLLLGAAAAVAIVVVVVVVLVSRGGDGGDTSAGGGDTTLAAEGREVAEFYEGIPQDGTRLGPASGAAMIEFADLQCPFCAQYALEAMPDLVERYVRDGSVAMELNILGFLGPDSQRAQQFAAGVAQQDMLFQFAELFYRNQGEENSGYVTEEFLMDIARAIPGLDAEQAQRDQEGEAAQQLVSDWEDQAATLGVNGTPSFYTTTGSGTPQQLQVADLTPEAFTARLDELAAGGGGEQ